MIDGRRIYDEGLARQAVVYQSCRACGASQLTARRFCVHCLSRDIAWQEAAGRGRVVAATMVMRAPDKEFQALAPYWIVLAEMEEGFRMMGLARSPLDIGARVGTAFWSIGERMLPCFTSSR